MTMHRHHRLLKVCTLVTTLLLAPASGFAQADLGINYQAIVRDALGEPMVNQNISIEFYIHQGTPNGPLVLADNHNTSTNELGLVSVVIGKGNAVPGALNNLDFHNTDHYLEVRVNGTSIGTHQLESVPTAFKATHMELNDLTDVGSTAPLNGQVLQWNGSSWIPATVAGGGGLWTASGNDIHYTLGNVGIGTTLPQNELQVHQPQAASSSVLQMTTGTSGSGSNDGLQLRLEDNGDGQLRLRENGALSLWSNNVQRMHINNTGRMGINRQGVIGSSDITLRSLNATGYGGMYVESPSGSNGLPFYGYACNNVARAWHYFDEATNMWKLNVSGDRIAVDNSGRIGMGTISMDASALLHLNSTTRGFLLPRMTTAQRTAIATPAEALLVYDTDLAKTMQFRSGTWQELGSGAGSSQWLDDAFGIAYSADGVGIGVSSSPFASLNLSSNGAPISLAASNSYSGSLTTYGLQSIVGTNGTGVRYAVHGNANAPSGSNASAYGVYGTAGAASGSDVYGVYGLASATNGGNGYGVFGRANGANTGVYGYAPDANGIAIRGVADQTTGVAAQFDGDVKVNGTASQLYLGDHLTLYTASMNGAPRMVMENATGTSTVDISSQYNIDSGARMMLRDVGGTTRINLYVASNDRGRVVTDELEIKGGADLAEHFDVNTPDGTELSPGMLVSISADGSGSLEATTSAYDRRVAGIVSGANGVLPGLTLRQDGAVADGEVPVALTGRVYVLADASNGSIAPGDLLTSADLPGHAMKATDRDRAQGAVIGKAMTCLDEGTGMVLVLVNLQ